jgi:hypothetical protein
MDRMLLFRPSDPATAALGRFPLFRPSHPALAQHRDGPPRYLPWQRQDSQEVGFCAGDRTDIDLWNRVSVPHCHPAIGAMVAKGQTKGARTWARLSGGHMRACI